MCATVIQAPDIRVRSGISSKVVVARTDESAGDFLVRVSASLAASGESGLLMLLFGKSEALQGLEFGLDCPVLALEGRPCHRGPVAGATLYTCASSKSVRRIRQGGRVVAAVYDGGEARHCLFGGFGGVDPAAPREVQAAGTLAALEEALGQAGFTIADIVRTWFYNENILDWYAEFNRVRTVFYRQQAFRSGSMPASTGVGGRHLGGVALGMAGWALQPHRDSAGAREVFSPLQCPAPQYGSSFSRAVEILASGSRRVSVSGTASIALNGESIWQDDIARQIEWTMAVIGAILASRGLGWNEVDRAIAYLKHGSDLPVFTNWLQQNGLASLPFVPVQGDICRDNLLFELEVDARVQVTKNPDGGGGLR